MPSAVKLSDDLVEAARAESQVASRSMTQQVEHWARIGRALERSGAIDAGRVRAALRADLGFDELEGEDRAAVLAGLEAAVVTPDGDAALAAKLADGKPRARLTETGRVVRQPAGQTGPKVRRAAQRRKKKSAKKTAAQGTVRSKKTGAAKATGTASPKAAKKAAAKKKPKGGRAS